MRSLISDFELEDFVVLALLPLIATAWALAAFGISATFDLDHSWFDPDRVATPFLIFRIAAFWPLWSTVQFERLLTSPGEVAGAWLPLLAVVTTVVPALLIGLIWARRGIVARR